MSISKVKCNYLVQLALADGQLDLQELQKIRDLIEAVCEKDLQNLIDNPPPLVSLGAMPKEQWLDFITAMIDVMNSDQQVDRREVLFIQSQAIKMGFKKEVVEELWYCLEQGDYTQEQIKEEAARFHPFWD